MSNHALVRLIRFDSQFTIHLCNAIYFSTTFSTPCKQFIKILHFVFLDLNRAWGNYLVLLDGDRRAQRPSDERDGHWGFFFFNLFGKMRLVIESRLSRNFSSKLPVQETHRHSGELLLPIKQQPAVGLSDFWWRPSSSDNWKLRSRSLLFALLLKQRIWDKHCILFNWTGSNQVFRRRKKCYQDKPEHHTGRIFSITFRCKN